MGEKKILYQMKLAAEGRKLTLAGLALIVLWLGAGAVLSFGFSRFPESVWTFAFVFVGGAIAICWFGRGLFRRTLQLRDNPGVYRISKTGLGRLRRWLEAETCRTADRTEERD